MKKKKRQSNTEKAFTLMVIIAIFALILVINAELGRIKYDQYKYSKVETVLVKDGDTLWSIAEKIDTVGSRDTRWTVMEIKRLSNLKSDNILLGTSLKVPKYEDSKYWNAE